MKTNLIMSDFSMEIASVPDRENLIAEIWYKGDLICELNTEKGDLEIEFYSKSKNFSLDYNNFVDFLSKAKLKLQD